MVQLWPEKMSECTCLILRPKLRMIWCDVNTITPFLRGWQSGRRSFPSLFHHFHFFVSNVRLLKHFNEWFTVVDWRLASWKGISQEWSTKPTNVRLTDNTVSPKNVREELRPYNRKCIRWQPLTKLSGSVRPSSDGTSIFANIVITPNIGSVCASNGFLQKIRLDFSWSIAIRFTFVGWVDEILKHNMQDKDKQRCSKEYVKKYQED